MQPDGARWSGRRWRPVGRRRWLDRPLDRADARRSLRDQRADRPRGHGQRLRGHRHPARPHRRDQGDARRPRRRRRVRRAVRPRGQGGCPPLPPQRGRGLRPGRRRRHGVPRDGADRRAHAARHHLQGEPDVAGQGAVADGAGALGARGGPPGRPHPPRREARERPDRRRRPDQGRRLRARQGDQRRHPAHRNPGRAHRHRLLPRPRARRRGASRRARRRVRRRRTPLRAAHRQEAPRGREPDPGGLQARAQRRAAALGAGARPPRVRRRAGRPRHRARPEPAARRRRRAAPPGAPGQPCARQRRPPRPRADPGPGADAGRRVARHGHRAGDVGPGRDGGADVPAAASPPRSSGPSPSTPRRTRPPSRHPPLPRRTPAHRSRLPPEATPSLQARSDPARARPGAGRRRRPRCLLARLGPLHDDPRRDPDDPGRGRAEAGCGGPGRGLRGGLLRDRAQGPGDPDRPVGRLADPRRTAP